ncbi:hypothetical protein M422DRAFT_38812 [Sphaerobolus stellatus SS14]|uniref:Uncharacterized protein n=1 Tax=Sphaerobolus stellatus (strain SS14) TaxID=990650 RepID=A0A0C9TU48_SPHS4|nr:hypothetical protein M422DRAFT_38812 [Sphaerobolus stellatus SS14]
MWYKERIMTEDEIVGSVMDAATNTLRWTIHRPRQGWYLRLRSPSLPPGAFIPLLPPPHNLPSVELPTTTAAPIATAEEGSLTFSVRTREPIQNEEEPTSDIQPTATSHSYPPSPPQTLSSQNLSVPNVESIRAKLGSISQRKLGTVRHFGLVPRLPGHPASASAASGFFSRALSYITPRLPIRSSYSFILSPLLSVGITSPLLTFTDQTPTFSVSVSGLLEVNEGVDRLLGIDTSFWITISLAYLEFLEDRESYLAAVNG